MGEGEAKSSKPNPDYACSKIQVVLNHLISTSSGSNFSTCAAKSRIFHSGIEVGWNQKILLQVGKACFELVDYTEAECAFSLARRLSPYSLEGMDVYSTVLYVCIWLSTDCNFGYYETLNQEFIMKFGVDKYDPTNEQFDPNRHNAVFQVPNNYKPTGTIAVVLKAGYTLHDRVIRPAEVGVSQADEGGEANEES